MASQVIPAKQRQRLLRCNLEPSHYLLSLLKEGQRAGCLDRSTVSGLQGQLLTICADLASDYTRGESDSVRSEVAENILLSILYCLDAYLLRQDSPEACLDLLQRKSLPELYAAGKQVVSAYLQQAWELSAQVRQSKLAVPLLAYQGTIDEAVPEFLRGYDPAFGAHQSQALMDYQLAVDGPPQTGVRFIAAYLSRLLIENRCCQQFSLSAIQQLLIAYGLLYSMDYRRTLTNIFEVVMNNSLFSVLSGGEVTSISVSPSRYLFIQASLQALEPGAVELRVKDAAAVMAGELAPADHATEQYLRQYVDQVFLPRLRNALELGTLDKLLIVSEQ